jgi:TDG/mug DNA glycosylase family protein
MNPPRAFPVPERCAGLDPVIGDSPEVLVLGSFPSRKSLVRFEYYGNPQNHFWQVIEALFAIDRYLSYSRRVEQLCLHRVALWDVIHSCRREGSADDRIREPVVNDINGLLAAHPSVRLIALNGTAAERCYTRYRSRNPAPCPVPTQQLPSTSPANTRYSLDGKCRCWEVIRTRVIR